MLLIVIVLFLVIALILFVQKVVLKGAMEKRLGRKVEDRELTSISSWMDATPTAKPPQNPSGSQPPDKNA